MLLAATDPSIVAAVLAATGAVVAGVFSLRSKVSADLVDDVMADRVYLKEQVAELRGEVEAMKLQHRECEAALLAARDREQGLIRDLTAAEVALAECRGGA